MCIQVPDGFKVGKISPPVYLTNEWVGYNALSEIFRNDWLTPAPVIQPPEENGDYVEVYDDGVDIDRDDDDSNYVYEDTYGQDSGSDALDMQVDQANDVGEDHDDDGNDETVDNKDNNHDDAPSWPRLVFLSNLHYPCFILSELFESLVYFQNLLLRG